MTHLRVVVSAALASVLVVLGTGSASALSTIPDAIGDGIDSITGAVDCKTPPKTKSSSSGRANNIDPGPDNPRRGDPFANPPTSTVYEVYGYGGLNYQSYDPGCLLDKLPGDAIEHPTTAKANTKFAWAATIAALANESSALVRDLNPLVETFNPVIETSTDVIGDTVWAPLYGIVGAVFVLGLVRRAKKAEDARDVAVSIGTALFIVVAVTFVLGYPTRATSLAHEPASATLSTVKDAFTDEASGAEPGVAAQANLYQTLVWKPFMGGMFCTTTGSTYEQYAGPLFASSVFTRWEDAQQRADPTGVGAELAATKQAEWQRLADEVQQVDPDAYECLKSARPSEQNQYANAALVSVSTVGGAQIVTDVMFLVTVGFALVLLAIFPLLGLLGLWNPDWVTGPWMKAGGLAVKVFLWAVVVQLLVNVSGRLYDEMDPLLASMLVAGVLASMVTVQTTRSVKRRRRKRDGAPDRPRERAPEPTPPPAAQPVDEPTPPPRRAPQPEVGTTPALTRGTVREGQPGTRIAGEIEPPREQWVAQPSKPSSAQTGEPGYVSPHSGEVVRMEPARGPSGKKVWKATDVPDRGARTAGAAASHGRESWSKVHRPAMPKPTRGRS